MQNNGYTFQKSQKNPYTMPVKVVTLALAAQPVAVLVALSEAEFGLLILVFMITICRYTNAKLQEQSLNI